MGVRRKLFRGGLRLDDRRMSWVYSAPPLVVGAVCFGLWGAPDGDAKAQAYLLLGLALVSMMFCWRWAFKLARSGASTADYVKGTTTSRMMVWFWAVFGGLALASPAAGVGVDVWLPLWAPPLFTFAGIGSVLLTAGPAYKEYKEVIHTDAPQLDPLGGLEPRQPAMHALTRFTRARPALAAALVLAAAVPSWLLGRERGRRSHLDG